MSTVSIVFLDLDGVVNSEAFLRKLDAQHKQLGHSDPTRPKSATTCECYRLENQIDRDAIVRLNRLIAETEAKIVISSSWCKLLDPPELARVLAGHGLVAEIIGETPDGYEDEALRETYGRPERIQRGHEIDYWLRQHPEVDRWVILDDCSDMAMHKNRLVQTDCEEGLHDEHVDLAIRVMSWDGKTVPSPLDDLEDVDCLRAIVSTRSSKSEDARRDFDGFDVDEELRRLRLALIDGAWRVAAELAANLDEHLCRGGSFPVAWLGPACMQDQVDIEARLRSSVRAAAAMTQEARQEASGGYAPIRPASAEQPGYDDQEDPR